jgi:hypothetical protein
MGSQKDFPCFAGKRSYFLTTFLFLQICPKIISACSAQPILRYMYVIEVRKADRNTDRVTKS